MINRRSEPYEDVGRTLAVMAEMAQRQKTDPKIRKVADSVTGGVNFPAGTAGRDEVATRIWRFIKREIRYVLDPAGTELVQAPDAILKTRHGDCDGMATLAAAMLAGLGIESGFRAVAWEERGVYQHVYAIYAPTRGEDVAKWHALDPVSPSPDGAGSARTKVPGPVGLVHPGLTASRSLSSSRFKRDRSTSGRGGSRGRSRRRIPMMLGLLH
mgnify:CR=1 FL=1